MSEGLKSGTGERLTDASFSLCFKISDLFALELTFAYFSVIPCATGGLPSVGSHSQTRLKRLSSSSMCYYPENMIAFKW